jgi:oligo-1,6-glucosidase
MLIPRAFQFIFDLVDMDFVPGEVRMTMNPWDIKRMKAIITKYQRAMIERDGWNSVFIENHDNPRSVSRFTDDSDEYRDKGAKLLALMQTTLSGTLFVYQGEEIGLRNVPKEWDIDEYKDVESINFWSKVKEKYGEDAKKMAEAREILEKKARDNARTPMQWTGEPPNAGFCDQHVKPWMRIMDDYPTINASAQMQAKDPNELSVWQFWQRGLKARKDNKRVFVYGDYEELDPEDEDVFAYVRTADDGEQFVVVLNFSGKNRQWTLPSSVLLKSWVAGNYTKGNPDKPIQGELRLEPWEGLLGHCS